MPLVTKPVSTIVPFKFNFPLELIVEIIVAGGAITSNGQLVQDKSRQSASAAFRFLRSCCLVSPFWKQLAQKLLLRQAYLFGEFSVRDFIAAEKLGLPVEKVTLRTLGKHGNTGKIERILEMQGLKELIIDGKEEYYSKLSHLKRQDSWLRKANQLESLSMYYVSHLLENEEEERTLEPLSLPLLRKLSLVTGNSSHNINPLIWATDSLESFSLVDREIEYELISDSIISKSNSLTSLRFNSTFKPTPSAILALQNIVTRCNKVQTLALDVAAFSTPSFELPLSVQSLEITTGQIIEPQKWIIPSSTDLERKDVIRIILKSVQLNEVGVEASLMSDELKSVCIKRGIQLEVVDYGRLA